MKTTGNTILITGGGSGIGRGLAEAFHAPGNQVIISGRSQKPLEDTCAANPGMKWLTLDVEDPGSIRSFAAKVTNDFPALNVLLNNAGIMRPENLLEQSEDLGDAVAMVTTNLLGPMRLTAALLPLLRKQQSATIVNVTSGLAFVPLAMTPTYCATKAAMHSYTESLRFQLAGSSIQVMELAPPYVATHLMGERQAADPRAMPLEEYIAEVMDILKRDPDAAEVCVERVLPLRYAGENREKYRQVFEGLNASAH